jgi:hypothetical protein
MRPLCTILAVVAACALYPATLAAQDSIPAVPSPAPGTVLVRYFHATIRCTTCLNIEAVARAVVREQYAGDSTVAFEAYNIDEPANRAYVQRFRLAGSSLIVCAADDCRDLTKKAFEFALRDIGRLQKLLIAAIDDLRAPRPK